eukprot:scaffold48415_cov61-Phaeocystis_antarctica.AAC.9
MSGVEVIEPAPLVLTGVARGQRSIALPGAGPLSAEVVAAKRGRCKRRAHACERFERAGGSGWASVKCLRSRGQAHRA